MHFSILLALWALIAFVLYKVYTIVSTELYHRRQEQANGCKRPPITRPSDFLGIGVIKAILTSDKECRMPQHLKERTEAVCEREGKVLSTFYQNVLGSPAIFTVDPKNIQAILATQFKDFGLGKARNNNFSPLLGKGIVSLMFFSIDT